MFETPPLEINFLRKASSYAQGEYGTSALLSDLSVNVVWRKAPILFSASKPGSGILGSG
jgi:hypothetical protein